MRKARSMHGKPRMDKVIEQRKLSQDDSIKPSTTSNSVDSSKKSQVEEVDHPIVTSNRSGSGSGDISRSSSKSPSVDRDSDHPTSPAKSDHQHVMENGDHNEVTEKTYSNGLAVLPPPTTSPPVLQGTQRNNL